MPQGVLGFKYEEEKKDTGMTVLAGLPIYLDLASAIGLGDSIEKHLHIKQQGWTDRQDLVIADHDESSGRRLCGGFTETGM